MSRQPIPTEAVEASAKALYERELGVNWDGVRPSVKRGYLDDARAALEAAAPYMLAGAWQAGHTAGDGDQSAMWDARNSGKPVKYADVVTPNPYRPAK